MTWIEWFGSADPLASLQPSVPQLFAAGDTGMFQIQLAAIPVLGLLAQWIAWKLKVPSILLLLITGFIAGPVTGFLDPDLLLGSNDFLFSFVSLAVGLILYEGGLNLRWKDIRETGSAVLGLLTVGALVTGALATVAAHTILGLDWPVAAVLGTLLIVSGPTVVQPLLEHIRPKGRVGAVARWEGIGNDPVGAIIAVLAVGFIVAQQGTDSNPLSTTMVAMGITIVIGVVGGLLGAIFFVFVRQKEWLPDHLASSVSLMIVLILFAVSNYLQTESGLLTVTVMGIALANQNRVRVQLVLAFKENLTVILLAILFIMLAARLDYETLETISPAAIVFLAVLVLVIRPIAVYLSTLRSALSWKERLFLMWLAPRGIVAAAVASLFALELAEYPGLADDAAQLVPVTFVVIVGTVALYGLTAGPLARWLGLAVRDPQGVLFVGAPRWVRELAGTLKSEGVDVMLVDTNWGNVAAARLAGLPAVYGNVMSSAVEEQLDTSTLGRLIACTPNPSVNLLAARRFTEAFGSNNVFVLPVDDNKGRRDEIDPAEVHGKLAFATGATYRKVERMMAEGGEWRRTRLSDNHFSLNDLRSRSVEYIPMFVVQGKGRLRVLAAGEEWNPEPGQTLISLAVPTAEERADREQRRSNRTPPPKKQEDVAAAEAKADEAESKSDKAAEE